MFRNRKHPSIAGDWLKGVGDQILALRISQYVEVPLEKTQEIINYDKLVEKSFATREDLGDRIRYGHTLKGFVVGDRLLTIRNRDTKVI